MELGKKSRARQPRANGFSSDRGFAQETRGKRVGADGLPEDPRERTKEKGGVRSVSRALPVGRGSGRPRLPSGTVEPARPHCPWLSHTGPSLGVWGRREGLKVIGEDDADSAPPTLSTSRSLRSAQSSQDGPA